MHTFWFAWARIVMWWQTDVWGWIVDVPCSGEDGGHCTGRRTGRPVPCPDCDRA
jgi:hypothetical protein